ncbi:hypothetical protein [Pelagibius sp. Alg239-R121]|uniref:hypothetical protein n=1 Tax=Pelagibius sp. Alg239-R121 TaxID=2993448 RepID=UPI0024A6E8B2|nr:hypothetical protein [Pelagibius sp. Alg239-R121]
MTAIHELTLDEFLSLNNAGRQQAESPAEQDMGALRLAYADQWRPDTLSPVPGRDGRYALAADWFATAFLLARSGRRGSPPADTQAAWEIAGIFSENLLFLGRPHRGALLSTELQIFGFSVRGGRVGRLPACTPIGVIARKSAYRISIRRAIAAGLEISESVLSDYRNLVKEKKARDETGVTALKEAGASG